jgi:acyl carrier protein
MTSHDVHGSVIRAAASALAVDRMTVAATETLVELPTFNSFRIVEIIERLEEQLNVELDPADLVPDNLNRVDALCALFEQAVRRVRG